jgi:sporulation protein YlmC with PRC-barrel domain
VPRGTGKMSEKFPKHVEMIAVLVRFASGCSCVHFVSVLDDLSVYGSAIVRRIVCDATKFVNRYGNQCRGNNVHAPAFVTQFHNVIGDTMRAFIYGSLLASAMLVPAFAQTNPPASSPPAASPSAPMTAPKAQGDMWRASKLIGVNVYNDQNEKLGDISEILLDKSGKVGGVVIGVGGFLGMGKHDILVQMDKLKFVDEPVRTSSTSSTGTTGSATTTRPTTGSTTASTASSSNSHKWYPDHAVMSGATKDSLKNMPEFKYD